LTEIQPEKILTNIEKAGRTCYKSENRITAESAEKFVANLIKSGHESVIEHESISVKFICDRGVSHELVRHRLASFSQESTRYCNYSKDKFDNQLTFIIPCWLDIQNGFETTIKDIIQMRGLNPLYWQFYWSLAIAETSYIELLKGEWTPQQARSVLPNSLKTEIVVTANLREWRTIFKQRTSNAAHPQMRELMCPLLEELKQKLPVIFNDIKQ